MSSNALELAGLRRDYSREAAQHKRALLTGLAADRSLSSAELLAAHDEALFQVAYPQNRAILSTAERTLRRLARLAVECVRGGKPDAEEPLRNSGVAGSTIEASFSFDLTARLSDAWGSAAEIAWDDDWAGAGVDELLPLLCTNAAIDGAMTDDVSTRDWICIARGRVRRADRQRTERAASDLAWLVKSLRQLRISPTVLDRVFKPLDLFVRWKPAIAASRTGLRFPPRATHFHSDGLQRDVDVAELLRAKLPRPARLSRGEAAGLIDTARWVLAARCRETDPITWAEPREVTLLRLERGIDVALFGMSSERRLPIESYFGFVAAKNRVPIAYGGGWVLLGRCEIGVNLFEEFRGGESALIFSQVMRVYAQYYRVRQFLVDPYQFGADNEEAIRSGAFWFYRRLGFHSVDADIRRAATRESVRIAGDASYRTPAATLRRFARAKLFLDIGADSANADARGFQPVAPDLTKLGLAVSRFVGTRFGGDRLAAEMWSAARVRRALSLRASGRWPEAQRAWFHRLAPLVAMISDLERWKAGERAELTAVMRAKGGPRERDYALALQRHERLARALAVLAR